ncbi:MAG: Dabb family protein [Eubacteriales bacterium]|nr:Dabb family protein [Eubacteriales bacterium]
MVTHVVMWNFKPEVKEEEKAAILAKMKEATETLVGEVPGLISARFVEKPLAGSTHAFGLISTHETEEDVVAYGIHPAHVKAADTYVRPYTCDRSCLNF